MAIDATVPVELPPPAVAALKEPAKGVGRGKIGSISLLTVQYSHIFSYQRRDTRGDKLRKPVGENWERWNRLSLATNCTLQ